MSLHPDAKAVLLSFADQLDFMSEEYLRAGMNVPAACYGWVGTQLREVAVGKIKPDPRVVFSHKGYDTFEVSGYGDPIY